MKNVLGFTEEITTCELCGKDHLKGTFAVEIDGSGPFYYGSTCAFKKGFTTREVQKAYSQYTLDRELMNKYNATTKEEAIAKRDAAELENLKSFAAFHKKTGNAAGLAEIERLISIHSTTI